MTEARPLAVAAGAAVRWRGAGLVGAKLLGVLRSVALAWLLVPDDFGLFAVALLPLDAVLCATDVGMLPALVQKRQIDNRDFDVAWTIGIARAVTVGIALFLAAPLAARLLGDPRATRIIQLVALRPLIAALASIRLAERERSLQFREIALVDLATAAVQTIVAIALAKVLGVWAMALGMLGGTLAGVTVSYWLAPSLPRFAIDAQRAVTLLRYGRWLMIGSAMAMLGDAILVAAITHTAGTAALGSYSLAASIALTPAGMIGSLVGGVAFAAHARTGSDPAVTARLFRSSLVALMALVLPAYAILIALAPTIVARMLDPRWNGLTPIVRILACAGILGLVYDGSTSLLSGVGRPRESALLTVVYACGIALLAWPLASRLGIDGAASARVLADAGMVVAALVLVRRVVRRPAHGLGSPALSVIAASAVGCLVARTAAELLPSGAGLVSSVAFGLTSAAITLVVFDRLLGGRILRDAALVLAVRRGIT